MRNGEVANGDIDSHIQMLMLKDELKQKKKSMDVCPIFIYLLAEDNAKGLLASKRSAQKLQKNEGGHPCHPLQQEKRRLGKWAGL